MGASGPGNRSHLQRRLAAFLSLLLSPFIAAALAAPKARAQEGQSIGLAHNPPPGISGIGDESRFALAPKPSIAADARPRRKLRPAFSDNAPNTVALQSCLMPAAPWAARFASGHSTSDYAIYLDPYRCRPPPVPSPA
jgi:hypothetical protein